jgi:predicted transcriptional regulator
MELIEKLAKLKKELPKGYSQKISQMSGYSPAMVSKVLSGKATNLRILEAALKLRQEYRQQLDSLISAI